VGERRLNTERWAESGGAGPLGWAAADEGGGGGGEAKKSRASEEGILENEANESGNFGKEERESIVGNFEKEARGWGKVRSFDAEGLTKLSRLKSGLGRKALEPGVLGFTL